MRRQILLAASLVAACAESYEVRDEAAASSIAATITPHFTARPIQGATCVAPCAMSFDAIGDGGNETVSSINTRAFHSVRFHWDYGDPASGVWPVSGKSRNHDKNALGGHVYIAPGTYTVTLKTCDGDGCATTSQDVTVADPNAVFATNTWCFYNTEAGNGCPAGATRVQTTSYDAALRTTCGVTTGKARCLFRRGDSFTASSTVRLSGGPAPGVVGAYGDPADPRPRITAGFAGHVHRLDGAQGWTVHGLDFVLTHGDGAALFVSNATIAAERVDNVTIYDLVATGTVISLFSSGFQNDTGDVIAVVGNTVTKTQETVGTSVLLFGPLKYALVLGNQLDMDYLPDGEFVERHNGCQHCKFSHNRLRGAGHAGDPRSPFALRVDDAEPTEWNVISDNRMSSHEMNCMWQWTASGGGSIGAENRNNLYEDNLCFFEGPAQLRPQLKIVFAIMGGDTTLRNNIIDATGFPLTSNEAIAFAAYPLAGASATNGERIHVFNNTVYISEDHAPRVTWRLCSGFNGRTSHECRGNLVRRQPNFLGRLDLSASGFTASDNLEATVDPFVAAIPVPSSWADFRIRPDSQAVNAGYDFAGRTDASNPQDVAGGCRSGELDVGAHEVGAAACP